MTILSKKEATREPTGLSAHAGAAALQFPEDTQTAPAERRHYQKDHKASVERGEEISTGVLSESDNLRDASQRIARNAWIAFRDACEANDLDQQESNYLAARSSLDELWGYAKYRDIPFRDLLSILTAATKYTPLKNFSSTQRDVLRDTFRDLPRWLLDYDTVLAHIEKFAEYDIDITSPIKEVSPKRFKVTIEEVE